MDSVRHGTRVARGKVTIGFLCILTVLQTLNPALAIRL